MATTGEQPARLVCATRGGEGSWVVVQRAIALAATQGATLTFLYIVDPESVGADDALSTAVAAELRWLGETLLRLAKLRAEQAGVSADVAIRDGALAQALPGYLRESGADRLLLGAPRGTTANVFGDDAIERFAQEVNATTGVTVEVIRPEAAPSPAA